MNYTTTILVLFSIFLGFYLGTSHLTNGFVLVDYQLNADHVGYEPMKWSSTFSPNDINLKFPPRYVIERFGVPVLIAY